jgi:hypothetical protein
MPGTTRNPETRHGILAAVNQLESHPGESHWSTARPGEAQWAELVELYEYKVGDLLAGRTPRGGKRSLGDLRDLLLSAPLEGALLRHFGQTDRLWKRHLRVLRGEAEPVSAPTWKGSEVQEAHDPLGNKQAASEQDDLEGLRFAVWRESVRVQARAQTQLWLREPDLVTLRSAYALSVNLERGETSMAVPRSGDPLASVATPSVAERIVLALTDQVCAAFIEPPAHHPGARQQALTLLRRAVTELSFNPFPRHPDQDVVQSRVEAAERDMLGADLTRTLIEGLQAEIGAPRSAEERLSIKAAAKRLSLFIESIIPSSEGGHGPELPPFPRVLYAATPRFQLLAPDDGSSSLTIRLGAESQAHWRGLPLHWKRSGEQWLVSIGALEYTLSSRAVGSLPDPEARSVPITLGDANGTALLHSEYLSLSARQNDRDLLELLALSRSVSLLLDPGGAYLNLRLARAAAQRFRDGRVDEASVSVLSAERYAAASPDALLSFARKGVEGLLTRMRQRSAKDTEQAFQTAAEAVGATEGREMHLLGSLRRVLKPETGAEAHPDSAPRPVTELHHMRVQGPGELVALEFAGEPLSVEVMNRVVTLRLDYKGDLAVILPGAPATILRELMVIDVAGGGILLVRQGGRVVISYQPHIQS